MKKFTYILILLAGFHFSSLGQAKLPAETVSVQARLVKSYPNPASSSINFEFIRGYDKSFTLEIYNFIGKKVSEVKNPAARLTINLDNFYRGVYIFQLRDKAGSIVESGKFQVIK